MADSVTRMILIRSMGETMKRLKYVSEFAQELDENMIQKLVARSVIKNRHKDITGVLMSSGRMFLQIP